MKARSFSLVGMLQLLANLLLFLSASSLSSLASSPQLRVAVLGGTHGNEYTGVWVVKVLTSSLATLETKYPSLEIVPMLSNPQAFMANRRFVDTDLNREFTNEKLCAVDAAVDDGTPGFTVEGARAQQLNQMLGSKCNDEPNKFDVAIDLHSTTSNMGTTLIINEHDPLMAQAAAYVALKCPTAKCLMHSIPDKGKRPNVSSATTHGFTIEVGPVPQGLLRHDAVLRTECALYSLLEFLQRHSEEQEALATELHRAYPSGTVPAYQTAPALRPGEMSGRIAWPSDESNPNFPLYMVHESLQDRDYQLLKQGDPMFISIAGDVIPYDGAYGKEVYVMFVNEGGYYYPSSGTGISVAVKAHFHLDTGRVIRDNDAADQRSEL